MCEIKLEELLLAPPRKNTTIDAEWRTLWAPSICSQKLIGNIQGGSISVPCPHMTCTNVSPIGRHKSWLLIGRGILNFIEYIYWSTKQSKHAIHTIIQIIICPKSIKEPTNPPTTRCRRSTLEQYNFRKPPKMFIFSARTWQSQRNSTYLLHFDHSSPLPSILCVFCYRIGGCFISSISATIKSHSRDWREEEMDGFYGGEWQSWEM